MLDRTDIKILEELQNDARIANAELAQRVGLSPSPCLRRVRQLEASGVIRRYAAIIDPKSVGLPISVFVRVSLHSQVRDQLEDFESRINAFDEIMECYLMTGESDYLLRIVVPDLESYERFLTDKLTRISAIANIQSSLALKQVAYRTGFPLGKHAAQSTQPNRI